MGKTFFGHVNFAFSSRLRIQIKEMKRPGIKFPKFWFLGVESQHNRAVIYFIVLKYYHSYVLAIIFLTRLKSLKQVRKLGLYVLWATLILTVSACLQKRSSAEKKIT